MKALVLILDSLPLSFLGCYGNDWIDTPALDRIAAEGVVFDRHYSDCPDPAAAYCAWKNGVYSLPPLEGAPRAGEPESSLFSRLRGAGVNTVAISRKLPAQVDQVAAELGNAAERSFVWVELPFLQSPWDAPEDLFQRYFEMEAATE